LSNHLPSEAAPDGRTDARLWKVPSRKSLLYGKDALLEQLHHDFLASSSALSLQSLNGLGGAGKTQCALAYVYRLPLTIKPFFGWALIQLAICSPIFSLWRSFCRCRKRRGRSAQGAAAILRWLQEHENWLLIFDNVVDLAALRAFLPGQAEACVADYSGPGSGDWSRPTS